MLAIYFITSLFICLHQVAASILIVSEDAGKSISVIEAIRGLNKERFAVEEVNPRDNISKILDSDDGSPLYHTIYYLVEEPIAGQFSSQDLIDFVSRGGNLLTILQDAKFLGEFGIDLIKDGELIGGKLLQWNSNHALRAEKGDGSDVSSLKSTCAYLLRNQAHKPDFNPLIHSALTLASGSAICSEDCISDTQSLSLLSTLETRRGSRFVGVASNGVMAALSDESLSRLLRWVQGDFAVMKIESFHHRLVANDRGTPESSADNRGRSDLNSTIYRVSDWISVRLCLNPPIHDDQVSDFQVELKLMRVQVRKAFESIDKEGCLVIESVQLPTRPGVYTLQIHHNRPGYSLLSHEERIIVRPYRTEEEAKWSLAAIPYHFSWLLTIAVSFFFLLPQLFPNPKKKDDSKNKTD